MNLSKRQFLKMGVGGAAGMFLARFLEPASLLGSSSIVPADYLESAVHQHWMSLSYNRGRESRQTRRILGAAIRNLGAVQGQGIGDQFAACFDQAVEATYRRFKSTGLKPSSCFGLLQFLYTNHIFPAMGEAGGHALFGSLLSMLRGLDGTPFGVNSNLSYLSFRRAALEHKEIYRRTTNPTEILKARNLRRTALADWRRHLLAQVQVYSAQRSALNANFVVSIGMLAGFHLYLAAPPPRLSIVKEPGRVVVSWVGEGRLQQAPTPTGPWQESGKNSPASFETGPRMLFFRTIQD